MEKPGKLAPGPLSAPVPLTHQHQTADFDCGDIILNRWLQRRALSNQSSGASRSYVACHGPDVRGYYALATSAVERDHAPSPIRRQMPDSVPCILLARLAVDRRWQGAGVGSDLLQDALRRCLQAADIVGVRAVLVHAIDDVAAQFYRKHGLQPSPVSDHTLMISITSLRASL